MMFGRGLCRVEPSERCRRGLGPEQLFGFGVMSPGGGSTKSDYLLCEGRLARMRKKRMSGQVCITALLRGLSVSILTLLGSGAVHAAAASVCPRETTLRFELSFPASIRSEPADGRVFMIIAREGKPEPRLQFGKEGGQYRSTPFFGKDVEALKPGQRAVVGSDALGYPVACLADLPAGDYFVQGLLNIYTTFRRADGHTVKLHMDQWEGQG